ncbi:MAG: mechanosensitive ion channel [Lachnospiraceae bacterium]|nr:mechanosensitive ion channel [Lachnospiraceae bacterium]
MFILADATEKELESLQQSVDVVTDTDKMSKFVSEMIDKGIAFGLKLIAVFVIFIVGRFIISKLLKIVDRAMTKSSMDEGVAKFLHSTLNVICYVVLLVILCSKLGIDTTSFAAILASGGLAIGLAFEGSLSNFAGGILILIMKPFKIGDYVESNGVSGVVEKIDIFYTSLITVDNKAVKLPNGTLSNSVLTNYSMFGKRRVDVEVGVHYDDDLQKAKNVLNNVMNSYNNILKEEANAVVVKELAESCVNLEIRMWVATADYWDAKFYLNENAKEKLEEAGITIPYNQLDVHLIEHK